MRLELRLDTGRLFPFVLFRSLAQMAFWLALVASAAAAASPFIHRQGELQTAIIGGMVGSLSVWMLRLPYELRIAPAEMNECLAKVGIYLTRSNMAPVAAANSSRPGLGEWVPNHRRFRWKGDEVEVLIDGENLVVRGPRSMIKPLWRNFRGPWRNVLTPAT